MSKIRGLLKAGQALSIVFAALCLVLGIVMIILAGFQNGVEAEKAFLEAGIELLVWLPFNIFGAVASGIAKKRLVNGQVNIGVAVVAIIGGVVSNIVDIPAGILMIIHKDKLNAQKAEPAPEVKEEKAEEPKAEE